MQGDARTKTTMASALGEFVYAFQNAAEYTLVSKFSEIRKLNPVQEEALMEFMQQKDVLPTGCGPLILIIKENTPESCLPNGGFLIIRSRFKLV